MDYLKQAEVIVAEHKAMEKYDPFWKSEADKGHRLSDRPIAFLRDFEIIVVGDSVTKVLDGLRSYLNTYGTRDEELAQRDVRVRMALIRIKRLLAQSPPPTELLMETGAWNSMLYGLNMMNIDVILTEGG